MSRRLPYRLLAVVLAAGLFASGCSSSSFLGQQWENFSAYYNTFYNAKQSFEQAEQSIVEGGEQINRSVYISVFPEPSQSVQRGPLQSAIEKSATLLREHPNSKYVEDALLLIGKSYYYQENFAGADQKFREVISLEGERADEARLWLARTLKATGVHEPAITLLEERLSTNDPNEDWFPRLRLMLGELYVSAGQWEQAAEALETGLEEVDEDRIGARGQFLLGQVYERTGNYERAAASYQEVLDYGPVYELAYAAQLNYVEVVGLHLDPERGLAALSDMQRDDKNYDRRQELALMRGRILKEAGRTEEARDLYHTILYPDQASGPYASGRAGGQNLQDEVHYRLAELYRDNVVAYSLAAAHFDSASGADVRGGPGSETEDLQLLPDAITGVSETAELYGRFSEVAAEVHRMDSLLYLGSLDQASFDSVISEIQMRRAQRARERRQRMEERQNQQSFRSQSRSLTNNQQRNASGGGARQSAVEAASGDAGFLFHNDAVQLQQSRAQFLQRWGDRPLVENWRRREAIRSTDTGQQQAAASGAGDAEEGPAGAASFLPPVDTSQVPRDSLSKLQMRGQRAEARYRLGNILFLMMNQPDSAATWYRRVIEEDGEYPVAARALYALAEVRLATGDSSSATRLYRELVRRYPASPLAEKVRPRLTGAETESTGEVDALVQARRAYEHAYHVWQVEGRPKEALDGMLTAARRYPSTSYAPRSLLAASYIIQETAPGDSVRLDETVALPAPSLCCDLLSSRGDAPSVRGESSSAPGDTASTPVPGEATAGTASAAPADSSGTGLAEASLFAGRLTLGEVLGAIETRYAETRYARRAAALRTLIEGGAVASPVAQERGPAGEGAASGTGAPPGSNPGSSAGQDRSSPASGSPNSASGPSAAPPESTSGSGSEPQR